MRVLHASESLEGGLGRFISNLAAAQAAAGHEVAVAAPGGGPGLPSLEALGVRFAAWEAGPRPNTRVPAEVASLRRIVRARRPDVVHLHSSKAGLAGRLLLRRSRPTIFQPHAWSFLAHTGMIAKATLRWERLGARWVDAILCVSDEEAEIGRRAGIEAELRVIHNGVDLEHFTATGPTARAAARLELGLDAAPLAVCIGRLHRQKNQHALLDVWPQVRAAVPDARLVLVGDGPDRPDLAARSVPGAVLVGPTDDVRPWLAAASVVVQPSRWEGMSLSLLEALACARSVVVTDVPGMREVAEGVRAVVPREDAAALATAIVERLADEDLADAEGRRGRRRVETGHDLHAQLTEVGDLYEEVLARRGRRLRGEAAPAAGGPLPADADSSPRSPSVT